MKNPTIDNINVKEMTALRDAKTLSEIFEILNESKLRQDHEADSQ